MSIIPDVGLVLLLAAVGCLLLSLLTGIIATEQKSDVAESIMRGLLFTALAMVMLTLFLGVLYITIGRPAIN